MAGRKITDEADAQRCLAAATRAGVSPRTWAHANQVDARSLNAWRIAFERRRASGTKARLVELVAAAPARAATRRYVIRLADVEVEVSDDFDDETLRRLLGVLAAC